MMREFLACLVMGLIVWIMWEATLYVLIPWGSLFRMGAIG